MQVMFCPLQMRKLEHRGQVTNLCSQNWYMGYKPGHSGSLGPALHLPAILPPAEKGRTHLGMGVPASGLEWAEAGSRYAQAAYAL